MTELELNQLPSLIKNDGVGTSIEGTSSSSTCGSGSSLNDNPNANTSTSPAAASSSSSSSLVKAAKKNDEDGSGSECEYDPIIQKDDGEDKYVDEGEYDEEENHRKSESVSGGGVWIHVALVMVQVIFGTSSIVGALGLPRFHPLTFALVRESCATILLLTMAHIMSVRNGRPGGAFGIYKDDISSFIVSGCGVFGGQAFYIIGVKLAGAVPASVWQPATPIVTSTLCMALGWEPLQHIRVAGILVAFSGCAYMVLAGDNDDPPLGVEGAASDSPPTTNTNNPWGIMAGHASFLLNTLGVSLYVMSSKRILATKRYEYITVTAWSYFVATLFMAISAFTCGTSQTITHFLCPDCLYDQIWNVPTPAIPALIWFILFTSATAYALIMWANQHASPTLVTGYTVLQPVITDLVVLLLLATPFLTSTSRSILVPPDKHAILGALAVIIGLLIMISTEPPPNTTTTPVNTHAPNHIPTTTTSSSSQKQQEEEDTQSTEEESMTLLLEIPNIVTNTTKTSTSQMLNYNPDSIR